MQLFIYIILFKRDISNKSAISASFLSVCFIPVRVLIYNMGNTIIAGIKTARPSASIHKSASMTNEATGTAFITFMGSHKNISIIPLIEDNTARSIPAMLPNKKPVPI